MSRIVKLLVGVVVAIPGSHANLPPSLPPSQAAGTEVHTLPPSLPAGTEVEGLPVGAPPDDVVHPGNRSRIYAQRRDARVMRFVSRHVDALGGVGCGHILIVQRGRLTP